MSRITINSAGVTLAVFTLAGCIKPMVMPETMVTNSQSCVQWVSQAEIAKANSSRIAVGDPQEQLLALALTLLANQNTPSAYDPCYQAMESFTAAYIATVNANASIINKAIGATVIPASIVAGGWAQSEILQGAGSVVIDAANSDISFDSGNVSSSGEASSGIAGRQGASPNVNIPDDSVDNTDNSVVIDKVGDTDNSIINEAPDEGDP